MPSLITFQGERKLLLAARLLMGLLAALFRLHVAIGCQVILARHILPILSLFLLLHLFLDTLPLRLYTSNKRMM